MKERELTESEMYEVIRGNLDKIGLQGYKAYPRKLRINGIKHVAGQDFLELDVVAWKNPKVWDIECKKPCTIEQFGFTLGQVIAYRTLLQGQLLDKLRERIGTLDKKIGKIDGNVNFYIALLETPDYKLEKQMKKTFRKMLEKIDFKVRFLTINGRTEEPKRHPECEKTS